MHDVKKAKYVDDYRLLLTFDDKTQKVVDFKKILKNFEGEVFQPLKEIDYFKKFKVGLGTVVWPNEADVCPDVLYETEEEVDINETLKILAERFKENPPLDK